MFLKQSVLSHKQDNLVSLDASTFPSEMSVIPLNEHFPALQYHPPYRPCQMRLFALLRKELRVVERDFNLDKVGHQFFQVGELVKIVLVQDVLVLRRH